MKEFLKGIKEGWAKATYIPPVYADRPSDATLAEGWRIAYEQEKERRIEAENMLTELMPAVTEQDRDELACLLTGYEFEDWAIRPVRSPVKYYSIKDADRLIAAGYRKVRR